MSEQTVRKVRKDINFKIIIPVIVVVLAICAGVCGYMFMGDADRVIADNVFVNSIDVSGLTIEEAKAKIDETVGADYFNKSVVIDYNGDSFELELRELVTVDSQKTAEETLKKYNKKASAKKKDNAPKQVAPFVLVVDNKKAEEAIINHFIQSGELDSAISFNDDYTKASVDASKLPSFVDAKATVELMAENVSNDNYDKIIALSLDAGSDGYAESLYKCLVRPAVDATVGVNEDNSTYIIPEIVGIEADKDEFLKLYKDNNGKFEIAVKPTFPEITTEDLDIAYYQDILGTYTSSYNAGLVNRTKNVTLAANLVNGTVIMPGKTFSYNAVVGQRTYARGFVDATVYTGEGTEEGIGGGICQVSSTIYCAQLRANLKTISRTNHSYTVVYVPLGQDATVVYGAIDYVFENNTSYPIKIETFVGGGKLTVNIRGTKTDKSMKYDVVSVQNSTVAKGEVKKETPDLPAGTTEVKQNGQNGAVVSTYKIHYQNGKEIKREYVGQSNYKPMNRIILVGTGAPVETEGEESTETDSTTKTDSTETSPEGATPEDVPIVETPEVEDSQGSESSDTIETEPAPDINITDDNLSDTGL